MHATIRHVFYYEDHPGLAPLIDDVINHVLVKRHPFEDIELFVPTNDDPVQQSHSFQLFAIAFETLVHADYPLEFYERMPETQQLVSAMLAQQFDDDYVEDRFFISTVHETV